MLCSASKDSDALLRLEGLAAYCVGVASMIIAYCVGFASMIIAYCVGSASMIIAYCVGSASMIEGCRRGGATSASASGRQYRPASYSQAEPESKCVITN